MNFSFTSAGVPRSFYIGSSDIAQQAIESLNLYETTGSYEHLKDCFGHLHHTISEVPKDIKMDVCLACNSLACSVFHLYDNPYRSFHIANSVSSIINHAKLDNKLNVIKYIWDLDMIRFSTIIQKNGFDKEAATEAGLVLLRCL